MIFIEYYSICRVFWFDEACSPNFQVWPNNLLSAIMIFTTLTKLLLARRSTFSKSVIYGNELKAFLHYLHARTAPLFFFFFFCIICTCSSFFSFFCCIIICKRALLLFLETKGSFDKLLLRPALPQNADQAKRLNCWKKSACCSWHVIHNQILCASNTEKGGKALSLIENLNVY